MIHVVSSECFVFFVAKEYLLCPKGVRSFSNGAHSNTFFECEEENKRPILKKCAHGQFYWPTRKSCHSEQTSTNVQPAINDLQIYSRPVLGDPVRLGDLYNSNTGAVLTGYSFWSRKTVLQEKTVEISPHSVVNVFETTSTFDRLEKAGFSSAVAVEVLGMEFLFPLH